MALGVTDASRAGLPAVPNSPLLTHLFIHSGIIMKYSIVKRKYGRHHTFTHAIIIDCHNAGNYSQSCKVAPLGINEMVISFDQLLCPL